MNDKEIQYISNILQVEKDIFDSWKSKLQIKKYKIGELVLNTNSISDSVLFLLDGKIRVRGISNNDENKLISLAILEPFEIVGLASNLLNKPIEIVTAGSNSTFLSISWKDWNLFYEQIGRKSWKVY